MRHVILGLAILLAVPAIAQTAPAPASTSAVLQASALHNGQSVKDPEGKRIGTLNRITAGPDGSVASIKVIAGDRMVTIDGTTLSIKDGDLVTSLTKLEISKLR